MLAIHGGRPVRNSPLPSGYPGTGVYGEEERRAVMEVIEAKSPFRYYGDNVLGKVRAFENALSGKTGMKYALGVTSCTASLMVALKALGIGAGDKVIVPSLTFIATAGAVVCAGAVPVFVDIDDSMNMDCSKLETSIDKYTRAIIVVHIQGKPVEMDKLMAIAQKHNLYVIEDVAQSLGARFRGRPVGSFGHISCFSLQLNKIITSGEGGAITTNDLELYERACRYHDQGSWREAALYGCKNETNYMLGQNYRMSELTGAVAYEQIKKLDLIVSRLSSVKKRLSEGIRDIKGISLRRVVDEEGEIGASLMMMLADKELAALFREALIAENIRCNTFYNGQPLHLTDACFNKRSFEKDGFPFNQFDHEIKYYEGMCPVCEDMMPRNVMITLNPAMTEADITDIIKGIRKVAEYYL